MSSAGDRSERAIQASFRVTKRSVNNALGNVRTQLKLKADWNLPRIDSYLMEAKQELDTLKDLCNELATFIDAEGKTDEEIHNAEDKCFADYDSLHATYCDYKAQYYTLMKNEQDKKEKAERSAGQSSRQSIGLSSTVVDTNTIKLPRVELHKFNGNRKDFHDWEGLFENIVVKDDRFDELQKLYYLKTLLEGDAAKLVANVSYEASSFQPTWKAVKDFYGNKRSLIAQHFAEILDLPPIKTEEDIRSGLCTISSAMRGLEVHGVNSKALSPMITFVVVRKFSPTIRREWEKSNTDTSNYPEFSALQAFLKNIAFAFEGARALDKEPPPPQNKGIQQKRGTVAVISDKNQTHSGSSSKQNQKSKPALKCSLCSNQHILPLCSQYIAMPVTERQNTVKRLNLCENCLKPNHTAATCRYQNCRKCDQRHNTTLHNENAAEPAKAEIKTAAVVSAKNTSTVLPSAIAYVLQGWRKIPARVLLDNCAELTLVSEDFIKRNRVPTYRTNSIISGATPGDYSSNHCATLKLQATDSSFQLKIEANVHPTLSYHVNFQAMEVIKQQVPHIKFNDSIKLDHDTIDIIIGSNYLFECTLPGQEVVGTLIIQESKFGWAASGIVDVKPNVDQLERFSCHFIGDVTDNLQKYFEVEEVDAPSSTLSEAEEIEKHFVENVRYLSNHKLSVAAPHKRKKEDVADTERMAYASLYRNERHLNAENQQLYNRFMSIYLEMGHMELIPKNELQNRPRYYLPHHAIIRPSSLTTVLRAVFNASAKNSSGCSLNDTLMVGPTIQPDLFTLLIKFRRFEIAMSADISKMYRCFEIHPEDRDMQRIVYRFNRNEPVQHYRLKTVTYGTSSAPFLAQRCLQKIADDNSEQFPEAAESIRTEFYMDDWLSGGHSVEEALQKQKDVHRLLAEAQLPLVKYSSNSKPLLSAIDNQLVEALKSVEFNSETIASILGLKWIQDRDSIGVKIDFNLSTFTKFTKRSTLSLVSRVFDPLGVLAPVTITGKILIQSIWRAEIGWDQVIPPAIQDKVETYIKSLYLLKTFELGRTYHHDYRNCRIQLIGFSDASESAYSAVLYLRLTHMAEVSSILICSKTKVAPIKTLTIPRLELCGAVLLTQLATRVRKILNISAENVYCFCDSTIALTWIRGPAEKYQVFIRNRSNFINSLIPSTQWYHIGGDQNPADLCTRGVSTEKFLQLLPFWSQGPEWLQENFDEFLKNDLPTIQDVPEIRKATVAIVTYSKSYFSQYSSWKKLVRVTAFLLRFRDRTHLKKRFYGSILSKEEVDRATLRLIRLTQTFYFSKEYFALINKTNLPARSNLKTLNIFLHSDNTIRVGGRLENAALSFEQKHPIVLPRHAEITSLIIRDLHTKYFHANFSLLLNFVRSKWWIVGGMNKAVKSVVRQCVYCSRLGAQVRHQIMADLPAARVQVSRPFSHTGVDYAGPLSIKCTNHRSTKFNKVYLAFFVCFATKAVHIEVVGDLTTEAFTFTFDRFISRRGLPIVMSSDNATNFTGFANVLTNDQLANYATSQNFTWKFIPARSPHVGGLWEAAVKSGKALLIKAIGQQVLTLEQLTTVTTKVEAILNSRPLCQDSSTESNYLTPAHFLIGSSLFDNPAAETFNNSLPHRYRALRQVIESFWLSWKRDYLHQLQIRSKWQKRQPNFEKDDVVLLKEDNVPLLQWPLGRITQVFTSSDGAVRSVEVLCRSKLLKRSIHNIVALPIKI
ncbi:hypothetical protein V9T40_004170 [Parthenolecanium corni]|uniref:Integrase catalytic domain-containing protein n=1 Tax=Parthenolecanium corni TaxID=536013 RepID=A0AAN9TUE4_9HEMI